MFILIFSDQASSFQNQATLPYQAATAQEHSLHGLHHHHHHHQHDHHDHHDQVACNHGSGGSCTNLVIAVC